MCILDGNAYDAKCLEAGQERDKDLEACSLLINNKQQALLVPSAVASHSPTAKVIVQLTVRAALKHRTYPADQLHRAAESSSNQMQEALHASIAC